MKILFIGGTGVISSACADACLAAGHALDLLNRGTESRPRPQGAGHLRADVHDVVQARTALGECHYDVVVDWIAYTEADIERDLTLFRGRCAQFVFISTAAVYAKPPRVPIRETDPLGNPAWDYAQHKVRCESRLRRAHADEGFPVTIVRPSHTYDRTKIPLRGGATALRRLFEGRPLLVHGDGTTPWTLTHHRDFARGFVPLLGRSETLGEAYHLTGDEVLTWNEIYRAMAAAAGVKATLVHVASETIGREDAVWRQDLLGDKAHAAIFDTTKIRHFAPDLRTTIPFAQGAREIVEWYRADPARLVRQPSVEALMDHLIGDAG